MITFLKSDLDSGTVGAIALATSPDNPRRVEGWCNRVPRWWWSAVWRSDFVVVSPGKCPCGNILPLRSAIR